MTRIGKYLYQISASNAELSFKTGLSQSRLSILRNDDNSKLLAEELVLISMAIEKHPWEVAEAIFSDLTIKLPSNGPAPANADKRLTRLGFYLEEKSRSQKAIEAKTGIKENRLSILANNHDSKILAEELYLITLAMEVQPQEIWRFLFGHLKLNPVEKQVEMKEKWSNRRKMNKK